MDKADKGRKNLSFIKNLKRTLATLLILSEPNFFFYFPRTVKIHYDDCPLWLDSPNRLENMKRFGSHWGVFLLAAVLSMFSAVQSYAVNTTERHSKHETADTGYLAEWDLHADAHGIERPVVQPLPAHLAHSFSKHGPDHSTLAVLSNGLHRLAAPGRRSEYENRLTPSLSAADLAYTFHAFW